MWTGSETFCNWTINFWDLKVKLSREDDAVAGAEHGSERNEGTKSIVYPCRTIANDSHTSRFLDFYKNKEEAHSRLTTDQTETMSVCRVKPAPPKKGADSICGGVRMDPVAEGEAVALVKRPVWGVAAGSHDVPL
jgi:hypothetical protein